MTDATDAPLVIPPALQGCAIEFAVRGATHVRATTLLSAIRLDLLPVRVPLTCVAPSPQAACGRLARLVEDTWCALIDARYPLS